jgi:hypothetical protein
VRTLGGLRAPPFLQPLLLSQPFFPRQTRFPRQTKYYFTSVNTIMDGFTYFPRSFFIDSEMIYIRKNEGTTHFLGRKNIIVKFRP